MKKFTTALWASLVMALSLLTACGGSSTAAPPLSANNLNLIFVSSPDLAHQGAGDVRPDTANLSPQGLQRSLLMATYLKQQLLQGNNVNSIHALTPMTHLQTANHYPDMAGIGYIQQFALQNQFTLPVGAAQPYTANSFPIHVAYTSAKSLPSGAVAPASYCPDCNGLDFNDTQGNTALVAGLIKGNSSGYHVFSAPWETISRLLAGIKDLKGYKLDLPTAYAGPNVVYALTVTAAGEAQLLTLDSQLNPPASYPVLPAAVATAACANTQQSYFQTTRTGGVTGVVVPANSNTNQRLYIVRHAEAHPDATYHFENGNFVGAGQWRALNLANALRGKISPNQVVSIDPAQWFSINLNNFSYVRPSLTVWPYAVANNLPYSLVSSISIITKATDPATAQASSDYFFTGGKFSNQTVLLAWESGHIRPLINALLASYGGTTVPALRTDLPNSGWPGPDYDTIWSISLDAQGNLSVDNALREGIDTTQLPVSAPLY